MSGLDMDLIRKNRRVIAERVGWPKGALEACERIEADWPGWHISWAGANEIKGFEHPAAFHASSMRTNVAVCGETPDALVAALESAPDDGRWHHTPRCCERPRG